MVLKTILIYLTALFLNLNVCYTNLAFSFYVSVQVSFRTL